MNRRPAAAAGRDALPATSARSFYKFVSFVALFVRILLAAGAALRHGAAPRGGINIFVSSATLTATVHPPWHGPGPTLTVDTLLPGAGAHESGT